MRTIARPRRRLLITLTAVVGIAFAPAAASADPSATPADTPTVSTELAPEASSVAPWVDPNADPNIDPNADQTVNPNADPNLQSRASNGGEYSNDPRDFPVHGSKGSGSLFWAGLDNVYRSKLCPDDFEVWCDEVDKVQMNITVNPGSWVNKITYTGLWFPDNGYFSDWHLQFYVISNGKITSLPMSNTKNYYGNDSDEYLLYNNENLAGEDQTIAARLWVRKAEDQTWFSVGTKTGKAQCAPQLGNDNQDKTCKY